MGIRATVFSRVTGASAGSLVSTRCYPDMLPENVTMPAIRYRVISYNDADYREHRNATERAFHRVQLDCYAKTQDGAGEPAIIVLTDDHATEPQGRDLYHGEQTCDLIVEIVIASQATIPGDDGGNAVTVTVPHTDEGMELVLDLIEAQVVRTLTGEINDWAGIWMAFVPRIIQRVSKRGASTEDGARFAARQLVLSCDLLADPVPAASWGVATAWGRFLAALDADPNLTGVAQILRAQIADDRADWRIAADALGITEKAADQIGIGPVMDLDGLDPQQAGEIVVDDEKDGGDMTIAPEE